MYPHPTVFLLYVMPQEACCEATQVPGLEMIYSTGTSGISRGGCEWGDGRPGTAALPIFFGFGIYLLGKRY